MENSQDTFETRKRSFISALSIYMTVPSTLSWRRSLSYRNQSKWMDCFLYDRDLRQERVKCFPILEWIKQFWRHQIHKHQNITSALVFTIVFVTFPLLYLFDCNFVDLLIFFFLQGKICAPKKSGASQRSSAPEGARSASGTQFVQVWWSYF